MRSTASTTLPSPPSAPNIAGKKPRIVCYYRVALLWGQEAATGLGVKADDGCCSGYLWY
jgi:hypothetical protein